MENNGFSFQITVSDNQVLSLDQISVCEPVPAWDGISTWVKLTFLQCPECPLQEQDSVCCPLAFGIRKVSDQLGSWNISYDSVQYECRHGNYRCRKTTDLQTALGCFFGHVFPLWCPGIRTAWNLSDTGCLFHQYISLLLEESNLMHIYRQVCKRMLHRLEHCRQLSSDAVPNALVYLHSFATLINMQSGDLNQQEPSRSNRVAVLSET